MIVQRYTFKVKPGCKGDFIQLTKALVEESGRTPRVCSYTFGPYHTVISDLEFESEEDMRKYWDEVDWSGPQASEWLKKHNELIESGATVELLQVH